MCAGVAYRKAGDSVYVHCADLAYEKISDKRDDRNEEEGTSFQFKHETIKRKFVSFSVLDVSFSLSPSASLVPQTWLRAGLQACFQDCRVFLCIPAPR